MSVDDGQNDPFFAGVAALRTHDVSPRHIRRLRRRCHALLQTAPRTERAIGIAIETFFRRAIGPALVGAWTVAYLAEIIRRAAAIYRLLP